MPYRQLSLFILLIFPVGVPTAFAEAPATWTQWRGPNRQSIVQGDWPDRLNEAALKSQWRVKLGPSYSTPIVSADSVFVTETLDRKTEVVRALDRKTGDERWKASWPGAIQVPFFAASNGSWIRATPALDEERLYVPGIRDLLVALDAKSGEEAWRVDFPKALGAAVPSFGCVSSPVVDGDHLYVQAGGCVAKLKAETGGIIWTTMKEGGGMMGGAFSSPVIATLAGTRQLVVQSRSRLVGVDLETGKELWSQKIAAFRGMNILTPLVIGDQVFTSAYGGRAQLFTVKNTNEGFQIEESWNAKQQAYMSSPVLIEGDIYVHLRNQRFTCLDAETGESRWTSTPFGKYWSTVSNGKKLLALDERGELLLIRPSSKEFELIDRLKLPHPNTWAHLVVCDRELFIRDIAGLSKFQWQGADSQ